MEEEEGVGAPKKAWWSLPSRLEPGSHALWRSREQPHKQPQPCQRSKKEQLPLDEELKSTQLRLLSTARPHMRAWHLSWAIVFAAFTSTFAPAALMPLMQDSLDLSDSDIANSNIASVAAATVIRMVVGAMVDHWGPRYTAALLLLGTAPAVFCLAVVHSATALLVLRLLVGISLCTFVVGQAWANAMFNVRIVGAATALSAGWGNAGGGAALLLMPLVVKAIQAAAPGDAEAWRWAFFVPGLLQVAVGVAVLAASDDSPLSAQSSSSSSSSSTRTGSSRSVGMTAWAGGKKPKDSFGSSSSSSRKASRWLRAWQGLTQVWPAAHEGSKQRQRQQQQPVMGGPPGPADASVHVDLPEPGLVGTEEVHPAGLGAAPGATGSQAAAAGAGGPEQALGQARLATTTASAAAAAQAAAAAAAAADPADLQPSNRLQGQAPQPALPIACTAPPGTAGCSRVKGSRGNIRAALGNYRTYLLAAAYAMSFGVELAVNNVLVKYLFEHFGLELEAAGALAAVFGLTNIFTRAAGGWGSDRAAHLWGMRGRLWVLWSTLVLGGAFCLLVGASHGSLPATVANLVLFSIFVQAGCGAVFGVVPFVSKRAVGLVTGVVASGGNIGALVWQALFFGYVELLPYQGLYWMGLVVLVCSSTVFVLYFPMWGGMCCRPRLGYVEEQFYLAEYSLEERARGAHLGALAFAHEARSNRLPAVAVCAAGNATADAATPSSPVGSSRTPLRV